MSVVHSLLTQFFFLELRFAINRLINVAMRQTVATFLSPDSNLVRHTGINCRVKLLLVFICIIAKFKELAELEVA